MTILHPHGNIKIAFTKCFAQGLLRFSTALLMFYNSLAKALLMFYEGFTKVLLRIHEGLTKELLRVF